MICWRDFRNRLRSCWNALRTKSATRKPIPYQLYGAQKMQVSNYAPCASPTELCEDADDTGRDTAKVLEELLAHSIQLRDLICTAADGRCLD
jgi:hypothetical protein